MSSRLSAKHQRSPLHFDAMQKSTSCNSLPQIAKGVSAGDLRPFLAKEADPLTLELIEACWANEPSARPAFGRITLRLREILANVDTFNKNGKHHSDGQEHHGIIGRLFHKSS
jgi:hypothetical protein